MSIEHVLAVVPVRDIHRSAQWYAQLLGRPADNNPMPTLVEWQARPGAWVQVFSDPARAGSGLLNFAVDDLDSHLVELRDRGLQPGDVIEADKGVRLSKLTDPDGNEVTVIGSFRVRY
ncbi:glyoxalase [Mycolicibacterium anyangense]|jgi:predicted enzyme related to lactoylglutathione lyase|uniref:Glyoxalase n=1 Tax=Mycolicibacterium anyangense TaxID=1431246 RepID=A0A6N4WGW8_9MYCO|nr:VOC family protein [Mycolicibacterium anyangense]BBZ79162.1 glyoxalase [Mycolicibacterium anyangense]